LWLLRAGARPFDRERSLPAAFVVLHRPLLTLFLVAVCASPTEPQASADTLTPSAHPSTMSNTHASPAQRAQHATRYDEMQAKASHNSYERSESLFDQLVYHGVHGLELDIHTGKGSAAPAGDFYVYHADVPTFDKTSCSRLSDCLRVLRAYHDAFPSHEVVTVFIDRKDDWDSATKHGPDDLDALVRSSLDPQTIFEPRDLLRACPGAKTLREAVGAGAIGSSGTSGTSGTSGGGADPANARCAFPTLASLRGKFVFGLTGGHTCVNNSELLRYVGDDAGKRALFIAPEVEAACPIERYDAVSSAIMLNLSGANASFARDVQARGLLSRVYGADGERFGIARRAGGNFIATDAVNALDAPASVTATRGGYPFACKDGACDSDTEHGNVIGMSVRSADLNDTGGDSFFSASTSAASSLLPDGTSRDVTWQAAISVPGSHADPDAKGCLMARESLDADSPYFAVCRPAGDQPMRVQFRSRKGGATSTVVGTAPAGFANDNLFFARMRVQRITSATANAPANATAVAVRLTGDVSVDGRSWTSVASVDFSAPLVQQGLSATSHTNGSAVHFVFGNVTREDASGAHVLGARDLAWTARVGANEGVLWDGFGTH
jgi:hypothetical protein